MSELIRRIARWILRDELEETQREFNAHVRKQDERTVRLTNLLSERNKALEDSSNE